MTVTLTFLVWGAISLLPKVGALALSFRRSWRDYLCVKIWFALLIIEDVAILVAYRESGFGSLAYAQIYYWFDLAATLFGFLVLVRLAELAFAKSRLPLPILRGTAFAILSGISVISFFIVFMRLQAHPVAGIAAGGPAMLAHKLSLLASELEQNVGVAGMIGSMLLWVSVNVLAVPGVRLRRIISGYGIFYSASGIGWALVQIFGARTSTSLFVQFVSLLSLLLLGYAVATDNESLPQERVEARVREVLQAS
jgi:hypothetical protein